MKDMSRTWGVNALPPRNIVLVGFMGAGKTTVGRLLAERLNLRFVDTDAIIERNAGMSIPEIFRQFGEPHFRALEAGVVQQAVHGSGQVVATGGGALGCAESLQAVLQGNLVVWLQAPLERLLERALGQGDRPLLADASRDQTAGLYATRLALYGQAHLVVRADQSPRWASEVVALYWQHARQGGVMLERIPVNLGERSYSVFVGVNLLEQLPELLPLQPGQALLVSDTTVADLYAHRVQSSLKTAGWRVSLHTFAAGEEQKTLSTLQDIYTTCVDAGLERSSPIIALGGGVVGDVAGFAAATYLRGTPFVQVPTTLLAQVDASVGGKVAVNLPAGKNLVGAFYQPRVVIADVALLASLPEQELLSGLAEVIKHGIIADAELFAFVEDNLPAILSRDPVALKVCVKRSCEIKGAVVEADERESARREILNFGHTVGHAIEAVSGYGTYAHGEAVAIGMVTAAKLAQPLGFSASDQKRIIRLLSRAGLPIRAPELPIPELLAAMARDKKVREGRLRFVLTPKIGAVQGGVEVTPVAVAAALEWQNALPDLS